jgi:hypothetical protein
MTNPTITGVASPTVAAPTKPRLDSNGAGAAVDALNQNEGALGAATTTIASATAARGQSVDILV